MLIFYLNFYEFMTFMGKTELGVHSLDLTSCERLNNDFNTSIQKLYELGNKTCYNGKLIVKQFQGCVVISQYIFI